MPSQPSITKPTCFVAVHMTSNTLGRYKRKVPAVACKVPAQSDHPTMVGSSYYCIILTLPLLLLFATQINALWPVPRNMITGTTALRLSDGLSITVSGFSVPSDLEEAIKRTKSLITNDSLSPLTIDRGASLTPFVKTAKLLRTLTLSLTSTSEIVNSITVEAQKPIDARDESYILVVPSDGSGSILKANKIGRAHV